MTDELNVMSSCFCLILDLFFRLFSYDCDDDEL